VIACPAVVDGGDCRSPQSVAPIWAGQAAVVAASGPSLRREQLDRVRGRARVLAVNDAWRLAPWADALYACDGAWWDHHGGVAGFAGAKWTQDAAAAARWGLRRVASVDASGLSFDPALIHQGMNSGYQALNLALHFGARAVVLLGFDLRLVDGRRHFFGDHPGALNKRSEYRRWCAAFEEAAPFLVRAGVTVMNATPDSALTCFPAVPLEDALTTLETTLARSAEHAKYVRAYASPRYAMGAARMADARRDLASAPLRGAYLDVGCGRGEMLDFAESIGFAPVQGVEVVADLIDGARVVRGEVHDLPLPDKSVDVATMFDVIEHLVPGDDERACRELARVARRRVLLTANNRESKLPDGTELHINRRRYDEWDALFREWFAAAAPGSVVTWIEGPRAYISEAWRVDL